MIVQQGDCGQIDVAAIRRRLIYVAGNGAIVLSIIAARIIRTRERYQKCVGSEMEF